MLDDKSQRVPMKNRIRKSEERNETPFKDHMNQRKSLPPAAGPLPPVKSMNLVTRFNAFEL